MNVLFSLETIPLTNTWNSTCTILYNILLYTPPACLLVCRTHCVPSIVNSRGAGTTEPFHSYCVTMCKNIWAFRNCSAGLKFIAFNMASSITMTSKYHVITSVCNWKKKQKLVSYFWRFYFFFFYLDETTYRWLTCKQIYKMGEFCLNRLVQIKKKKNQQLTKQRCFSFIICVLLFSFLN